jgi:glycosyltransferase involved in cell wall biosynthesis
MHLIIAHSQLATFGGGERTTIELLRRLGRRHEVTLWAGGYAPERTFSGLRDFPRVDLAGWQWLTARPHADAIISHSFGARLLALHHPRVIAYLHTLRSAYLHGSWRPDLVARRSLDRLAVRRAATLLANSTFTATRAALRYGRASEVLALGVEERLLALPEHVGNYALYVGRLAPEKGLDRLLSWMAPVPYTLVLVGDGDPAYVAHLRRSGGARVQLRGPLTGAALEEIYTGCRFLVFTPYQEEFGLAVLEAMAAGKPVLAVAEGGLPELVHNGESGFLADDAAQFVAATERLLSSDELCQALGREGRRRARAYSWDRFAASIELLCEQLNAG